jgi:nitrous-oxide reductase
MTKTKDKTGDVDEARGNNRREFLTASVALGTAAALTACNKSGQKAAKPAGSASGAKEKAGVGHLSDEVPPGQLDDYYGFWSGGQSGEIRILGIPSMREIKRIAVVNRDSATGWGITDFSKKLLNGMSAGDTHHVHLSYKDGTYDGRYVFVNDKANARLARVNIETMECDKITEIPNSQGTHGIFPQRHKTGYVVCNAEFCTPQPNDGRDLDDPKKYYGLHTAIDGETMEVKWQVMVESNMDLAATDYKGLYSFATSYNTEHGTKLEQMMAADRDYMYVFNLKEIEKAVAAGKTMTIGDSKVPVVDARGAAGKDNPYTLRVPVPKSPHGVNIDPTGRYAVCSGKLSPTTTVIDIEKIADAFAGKIKPRDCVVAEPEVGLGPLHTAFDGRGNAYTSIFIDSVVTKWNIDKAIKAYKQPKGEKKIDPIIQKIDVHYQIGHTNASMSETKEADGKWLIALCKFSKDRFLNVGPLHPENDQLLDISGEKMRLVHDEPAYSEPHDCVVVRKDLIHPKQIQPRTAERFKMYEQWAKEDGVTLLKDNKVVRKGDHQVRVYITSMAPKYGLTEFRVKKGDTVQVVQTNIDNVEDLTHGFCMSRHDIIFVVNPQDTQSATFVADKPGIYWYYCPWFCHALHLEMRGRMIVEA